MDRRRSDRSRARAAYIYLEAAGFRCGDIVDNGRRVSIEVGWRGHPSDNRSYEDQVSYHVALARQCLKRAGLEVDPMPVGRKLFIPISTKRKPRGRPIEKRSL